MFKKLRYIIAKFVFKHLFNGVTEDDILQYKGGMFVYRNTPLSEKQVSGIIEQAKTIQEISLFKMLMEEMKFVANERLYHQSTSVDDMLSAKSVLWTIDILEKKIDNLAKIKTKK